MESFLWKLHQIGIKSVEITAIVFFLEVLLT